MYPIINIFNNSKSLTLYAEKSGSKLISQSRRFAQYFLKFVSKSDPNTFGHSQLSVLLVSMILPAFSALDESMPVYLSFSSWSLNSQINEFSQLSAIVWLVYSGNMNLLVYDMPALPRVVLYKRQVFSIVASSLKITAFAYIAGAATKRNSMKKSLICALIILWKAETPQPSVSY